MRGEGYAPDVGQREEVVLDVAEGEDHVVDLGERSAGRVQPEQVARGELGREPLQERVRRRVRRAADEDVRVRVLLEDLEDRFDLRGSGKFRLVEARCKGRTSVLVLPVPGGPLMMNGTLCWPQQMASTARCLFEQKSVLSA